MPTTTIKVKDGLLVTVKKQTRLELALTSGVGLATVAWLLWLARGLTAKRRVWVLVSAATRLAFTLFGAGVIVSKFIDARDQTAGQR
jgi:hypothetical protein